MRGILGPSEDMGVRTKAVDLLVLAALGGCWGVLAALQKACEHARHVIQKGAPYCKTPYQASVTLTTLYTKLYTRKNNSGPLFFFGEIPCYVSPISKSICTSQARCL